MRNDNYIRRVLIATVVTTIGVAIARIPTASASPSPHAEVRNPVATRVIFAGRGYRLVRPVVEVSASRPAPIRDHAPHASDSGRDDARTARHSRTQDRVAVEPPGKDRQSLQRLPDTVVAVLPAAHGRSLQAGSSLSTARGDRRSVLVAVFHEAHAPPVRS